MTRSQAIEEIKRRGYPNPTETQIRRMLAAQSATETWEEQERENIESMQRDETAEWAQS